MATTKFEIPKDFSEEIRSFRLHYRLTQAQVAERLGVATNYVGMLEAGVRQPSRRLYKSFKAEEKKVAEETRIVHEEDAAFARARAEQSWTENQSRQNGLIADIADAPTTPGEQAIIALVGEGPAGACRRMTDPELMEQHAEFLSEIVLEKRELFRQAHAEVLRAIAVEFDARLRSAKAALLPKS